MVSLEEKIPTKKKGAVVFGQVLSMNLAGCYIDSVESYSKSHRTGPEVTIDVTTLNIIENIRPFWKDAGCQYSKLPNWS